MALNTAFYLVSQDIAKRAGLVGKRYIAPDGRYILDNKDLSRVRFTADEYVGGLRGVTKIDELTAKTLIARGGYRMQAAPMPAQEIVSSEVDNGNTENEGDNVDTTSSADNEETLNEEVPDNNEEHIGTVTEEENSTENIEEQE